MLVSDLSEIMVCYCGIVLLVIKAIINYINFKYKLSVIPL